MTPAQRAMRARIAAHESWARTPDPAARTAPARTALEARFAREVDPDCTLPPDELVRRVRAAKSAHYTRLALASSRARSKRKAA